MRVVFLSNFFNHHQEPLAEALSDKESIEFYFIETEKMPEERKNLGYKQYKREKPPYILSDATAEKINEVVLSADIVIVGSAPYEMVLERLKRNKIVFFYSERLFKNLKSVIKLFLSGRIFSVYRNVSKYSSAYLLCASYYAKKDFENIGCFKSRMFAWGYFPVTSKKSFEQLKVIKTADAILNIVWVGRLIKWKHPEHALYVAKQLNKAGITCRLHIIGDGSLKSKISNLIKKQHMEDYCIMYGAVKSDEVRIYFEKADIFLFTSDKNEGWGAVLNEGMSSACCVYANSQAGATKCLINHGENGFIYHKSKKNLLCCIKNSIGDNNTFNKCQEKGYYTMENLWNAELAVNRLISVSERLLNNYAPENYEDGPMSKL